MALVWFVDKFPRSRKPVQYRRLEDIMASEEAGLKSLQRPRHDDLLPIILPCALCCSNQQMSTSVIANELMKQRTNGKFSSSSSTGTSTTFPGGGSFSRSRSLERGRRRVKVNKQLQNYGFGRANNIINNINDNNSDTNNTTTDYNDFLQLCEHVECLVQQSMAQISSSSCSDQDHLMITKHYSKDTSTSTKNNQLVMEDDLRLRSLRDANRSPSQENRPSTITSTRGHYAWLQNRPNNTQCSKIL